MPKLLFFIAEDWYFRSHRLQLAQAALRAGFEVVLLTRVSLHRQEIESAGVRVIEINMQRRSMNPLVELLALRRVFSVISAERPDVLHLVALKPIIYGGIAGLLLGVERMVCAVAGLGYIFTSRELKAKLLRPIMTMLIRFLFNRHGVRVIVQNPDDRGVLEGLGIERKSISLIRGAGIDPEIFSPSPEDTGSPPLVLFASRMIWDKGVGEFVAAGEAVKARGISARFVLVGEPDSGNPSSIPLSELNAWNESGKAEWWGQRDDMPEIFRLANLVCLPTAYGEGVPKVLIEAAACGRAIIATDAPGCREIVRHGENGLLVPLRDKEALAAAISRLLGDTELRKAMGARGREIAMVEFSIDKVVDETLKVYRELLAQ